MTSNKDVYANLKQGDYQFAVDVEKVGENGHQFDNEYEQFEMSSAKSK